MVKFFAQKVFRLSMYCNTSRAGSAWFRENDLQVVFWKAALLKPANLEREL